MLITYGRKSDWDGDIAPDDVRRFLAMVEDMREAQRSYFATRAPSSLNKAKQLEKHIDSVLKEMLTGSCDEEQNELF
jgi:hypothetical protein